MKTADAIVHRLSAQSAFLIELTRRAAPGSFDERPPGKWSGTDVVAHLARYHEVMLERVETIVAETRPRLSRYRAEDDPLWPEWRSVPLTEAVKAYKRGRSRLIGVLRKLPSSHWRRVGIHPVLGAMKLREWMEFFLAHEGHHIYGLLLQIASATRTR